MRIYLACLSLVIAAGILIYPAVANPIPAAVKTTKIISPTAALERLITAEKLEARWFTPEFLKAADLITIQFQRDLSLKLGSMRYGNYKSVRSIGGDRYQIIFDRAEPDAVIAQFYLDKLGRIAGIRLVEKKNAPNVQAQVAAQAAVDRSFRTNVGSNGKPNQLFVSLKQWLGTYRKVIKKDASNYLGIFDRGTVPVTVNFKPDGSILMLRGFANENFSMSCPTAEISLKQAPSDLQKIFSNCPNLK